MNNAIETDKKLDGDILREQVRLAVNQIPTMQLASLVVALVLSFVARNIAPQFHILSWLLMIVLATVGRFVLCYRVLKVRSGREGVVHERLFS